MTSLRRCLEPGCGRLARASRCDLHTNTKWAGRAGVSMGSDWPRIRARILERDRRRCVSCGSRVNLAVDHIVPRFRGGTDADANLRTLCKRCHATKTQAEALEGRRRKRTPNLA